MSKRRWEVYAAYILITAAKIRRTISRGDILQDEDLYNSVLRNLQTLCEATQHLPEDKKRAHPHIPWQDIKAFRNILVHDYLGEIDPQTVLAVVRNDLPVLEQAVRSMLLAAGKQLPEGIQGKEEA